MHQKICEHIVAGADSVEAAFTMSSDGLPLSWHLRRDAAIDDVASVSAGLLGIARELRLFDMASDASMVFETTFGAMFIRTINPDTLLVLCLVKGYSFLTINRLLQRVLTGIV